MGGNREKLSAGGSLGSFAFAEDGSALFVEDGKLFQASADTPPIQVDELPVGTSALSFVQAGRSVVFSAITGADPAIYNSGTTELYAADLTLAPPAGGFSAADASLSEDARPTGIEVRLARTASVTTTVSFSVTGGNAVAGLDYTLGAGPLSFAPSETVKTLPLTILDRPHFNGSRTLVITLGEPTLAAAPTMPMTITITILDNEVGLFLPLVRR